MWDPETMLPDEIINEYNLQSLIQNRKLLAEIHTVCMASHRQEEPRTTNSPSQGWWLRPDKIHTRSLPSQNKTHHIHPRRQRLRRKIWSPGRHWGPRRPPPKETQNYRRLERHHLLWHVSPMELRRPHRRTIHPRVRQQSTMPFPPQKVMSPTIFPSPLDTTQIWNETTMRTTNIYGTSLPRGSSMDPRVHRRLPLLRAQDRHHNANRPQ